MLLELLIVAKGIFQYHVISSIMSRRHVEVQYYFISLILFGIQK